MKLYINDRFITLIFEDKYEKTIIKNTFTYKDESKAFTGGEYNSLYVKKICFVKNKGKYNFLYSGFLYDLSKTIKANNIKVSELTDKRTKFDFQKRKYTNEELKKYFPKFKYVEHQIKALRSLLKPSVGIISAPTSSGKTALMIAFLKATSLPALIVVNRISLALQLKDRIKESGIRKVGIYHGKASETGDVVISTIGSIKKISDLHKFKVLILDETHHACSKSYQNFLTNTSYPIRFGFSATPNSGDKYKWALIRQFIGNVVCEIEARELIKNEVIAMPRIQFVKIECRKTLDWSSAIQFCIVENDKRNKKIKEIVEKHKLPTLILIRYIEHGEILKNLISGSVFLSGVDDAMKRKQIIKDFENNIINIIISTSIFYEGISIDAIRLLIIATGGKSKIETAQKIGRGLRITPQKKEVLVYDFLDKGNRFTEKHSNIRKNIYKKCGFEVY